MKTYILLLIIVIVSIIMVLFESFVDNNFKPSMPKQYMKLLSPIQDLDRSCDELGYKISSMPLTCVRKDGTYDMESNCKCVDDNNYCTVCYPKININRHNYQDLQRSKGLPR